MSEITSNQKKNKKKEKRNPQSKRKTVKSSNSSIQPLFIWLYKTLGRPIYILFSPSHTLYQSPTFRLNLGMLYC
ncbi:hypothetical protein PVK06_029093 [Gossypium arboreum]|uniref:Uncharacterized protein n=1 Tax=Gossypium arboreum TaxID=29729 RepID=A0ABR0P5M6_GOSAR|nr:hypothetical protein PVK06_029093 [Gossypium arboreum]